MDHIFTYNLTNLPGQIKEIKWKIVGLCQGVKVHIVIAEKIATRKGP